jgi:hypothetical protein
MCADVLLFVFHLMRRCRRAENPLMEGRQEQDLAADIEHALSEVCAAHAKHTYMEHMLRLFT